MELVFIASLVLMGYIYIGYPLLVWLLARIAGRAVNKGEYEPQLVMVIVAYNEAERIGKKIENCLAVDYPESKRRILIVSDGSDDGMNEVVLRYASRRVDLMAFASRRGKAACLNDAIASCEEEVVVLLDARQEIDAVAVRTLVENFADPRIGAVSGELVFRTRDEKGFGDGVDAYWHYEKFIRRQESQVNSTVGVTGALYALRRELFRPIPGNTILDDVVIPMNVVMRGFRVIFENGARAYDLPSVDHRQERLRKIRTIAGNYQLLFSHPRFLNPVKNSVFFQLVSHKALRLVGPVCLALLLFTNVVLAMDSAFYRFVLAGQLAAYALAVGGMLCAPIGRLKPARILMAFLTLNWFAVLGLVAFLRNRNAHLWRSAHKVQADKP